MQLQPPLPPPPPPTQSHSHGNKAQAIVPPYNSVIENRPHDQNPSRLAACGAHADIRDDSPANHAAHRDIPQTESPVGTIIVKKKRTDRRNL
uniref:Uncharacterized protein n=1 Tax=Macrostomum lignano TaxID=282301 RepID=A0A1I8GTF9_9PLAT